MNLKFVSIFKYFTLFAAIYFIVFSHLTSVPIRVFDEARLAHNAYEMSKTGNVLVTTYEGLPDMWNTKPPLMIWLQALGILIFGANELPIRLPSALAALFTCVFIIWFFNKVIKDFWFGFSAIIVLLTSVGYIQFHAVRTGDYDALLTLFTTLYTLFFFLFVDTNKTKYLYYTFIAIVLATLTKGIAGLIFTPVLPIYLIINKKFIELTRSKHLYFGFLIFILTIGGYYGLREIFNPGYIDAVLKNEVGGRYLNVIEGHDHSFWFFYRLLLDHHYSYWFFLISCGIIVGYFHKNEKIQKLVLYSTGLVLFYFLVISFGKTKLEWYNVPLYPFLAIIVGCFIHFIFKFIGDNPLFKELLKYNALPFVFLFLIFVKPVSETVSRSLSAKVYPWDVDYYRVTYILKDALKGKHNLDGYKLLNDNYAAHNYFYVRVLKDKGVDITFESNWKNVQQGNKIIVYQENVKDYIEKNYSFEIIQNYHNVIFYQLKEKLTNE